MILNLTLISLSTNHFSVSPYYASSRLSTKHSLSIRKSNFNKFFNTAIYEISLKFKIDISKSQFSHFLNTAITVGTKEFIDDLIVNESYYHQDPSDIICKETIFKYCGADREAGAITAISLTRAPVSLQIWQCKFIICIGNEGGAINFQGKTAVIKNSCFECNIALAKYQAYYLHGKEGPCTVTQCNTDQCSPKRPIGLTFALHIRSTNSTLCHCNHTRSFVKERRAIASIGECNACQYMFNVAVNNSGQTFFGFTLFKTHKYTISDCLVIHCMSLSYAKALIETSSRIVIQRFAFYQTKNLFSVSDDQSAELHKSHAIFIDCVTDYSSDTYFLEGNIELSNVTRVPKTRYNHGLDFRQWECMTDVPPTPRPSASSTPLPTPTKSAQPTPSLFIINMRNEDAPEMVDLFQSNENKFGLTKSDLIQLGGLAILLIVTIIVFILVHKKKKKGPMVADDENDVLLKY